MVDGGVDVLMIKAEFVGVRGIQDSRFGDLRKS